VEIAPTGWLSVIRLIVTGTVLFFIPGWLFQSIVLWDVPLSLVFRLPLSFTLSAGGIALLGIAAYVFGGSLDTVQALFVVWLVGLIAVWLWRFGKKWSRHPADLRAAFLSMQSRGIAHTILVLLLAALCAGLALYGGGWLSHKADGFYHLAAIRRQIDTGTPLPQGLFYVYEEPLRGLNPTAGTWHLVLALFSLWSQIDMTWIWQYLPALIAPLLVLSFYSFALSLCKRSWLAFLGTALQLVLYDKLDFRASVYPNQAGLILLWCAWTLTWMYIDSGRIRDIALIGLVVIAMASWHLLIVEFFFVALVLYLLLRSLAIWFSGESRQGANSTWWADLDVRRLLHILIPAFALVLPVLAYRILQENLAYHSTIERWLAISPYPTFRSSLNLGYGFSIIGPIELYKVDLRWRFAPFRFAVWLFSCLAAILMIPFCLKRQRFILFMAATVSVIPLVLLNPFLITFLQGKMIDIGIIRLVLLPPYGLILAWFFWEQIGNWIRGVSSLFPAEHASPSLACRAAFHSRQWAMWPRQLARLAGLVAGGALIFLVGYVLFWQGIDNLRDLYDPASQHVYSLKATHEQMRRSDQPPYEFLIRHSAPDAVVLSDPESSYYLGGLTGRAVVAVLAGHYPPPTGPSHQERQQDSLAVLDPGAGLDETTQLLDKYKACLIWVDSEAENMNSATLVQRKFEGNPNLFNKVYEDAEVTIYHYLGRQAGCVE